MLLPAEGDGRGQFANVVCRDMVPPEHRPPLPPSSVGASGRSSDSSDDSDSQDGDSSSASAAPAAPPVDTTGHVWEAPQLCPDSDSSSGDDSSSGSDTPAPAAAPVDTTGHVWEAPQLSPDSDSSRGDGASFDVDSSSDASDSDSDGDALGPPFPECGQCGARHGAPGQPAACLPRVRHVDGQRKRKEDVGPHMHGHVPAGLPAGLVAGAATGSGNNCLVHSLMQLVSPSPTDTPGGAWADEVRRCREARTALRLQDASIRTDYLSLADWWQPILTYLDVDPTTYTVRCYTPEHGGEHHGHGPTVLHLWNGSYTHYEPVTPAPAPAPAAARPAAKRRRR